MEVKMVSIFPFLTGLYFLAVIAIVVYVLYMISRSVKALEKIADIYAKKNSSV